MSRYVAALAVAVALAAGLLYWDQRATLDDEAAASAAAGAASPPEMHRADDAADGTPADGDDGQRQSAPVEDCLTPHQIETHPLLLADAERLEPAMTSGATIKAYRGLTESELESLAVQEDSAAMTMLGALQFLRAIDRADADPVAYLTFEDSRAQGYRHPDADDPVVREQLTSAREWFYRAALHGRLMALWHVGNVDSILVGGPVELGWIAEDDFVALSDRDRTKLHAPHVYVRLAFELEPQMRQGIGAWIYDMIERRDIQEPIMERLAVQFENDRVAAGLPPIELQESTAPPLQELFDRVCEEYEDDRFRGR